MKRDEITRIYDDSYAATYEDNFLVSPATKPDSEHELELLRGFLRTGSKWLDVACGTGYFLKHFPDFERAGIDLSPAMLRRARDVNPGISLMERDFREPNPYWANQWDLVSCMWYAYGLVETVGDISRLIENLCTWTAPGGTCFMPLADPRMVTGVQLPYEVASPFPGKVIITGIIWSYIEDGGRKVHSQMIAPNVEFMVGEFARYFEDVVVHRYPPPPGQSEGRPAIIATRKRTNLHRETGSVGWTKWLRKPFAQIGLG